MNNLPSILTPDLGLLFWMGLAFLVVLIVLGYFAFPSIVGAVEERKNFIDESLRKAHEAAERLDHIKQEGEAMMLQAREEQASVIKEAAQAREAIVEQARSKAQEESARILADAKKQIEVEKQNAVSEIRAHVAELSVQIAEKIIKQKLANDDEQMKMIDQLLDQVEVK